MAGGLAVVGLLHRRLPPAPAKPPVMAKHRLVPPATPPAAVVAGAAAADTAADRPFSASRRTEPGPRQYVGTVGGQPATAELRWVRPDSVVGRFYFWQRGHEYQLAMDARHHPLVLTLGQEGASDSPNPGRWQLTQLPGRVLQGTWVDSAGQSGRPVVLRESYQSSVRYEIQNLTMTGSVMGETAQYSYDFIHLLGPAARRLPLSRVQPPPRAEQRRLAMDGEGAANRTSRITVLLNGFQLLSYQTYGLVDPFGGENDEDLQTTLVDLTTGRQLAIASQLRPRYALKLRRLLTHHLLHDPEFDDMNKDPDNRWNWRDANDKPTRLVSLPGEGEGFGLTASGLEAQYYDHTLHGDGPFRLREKVLIPYRELRPLVRSGTPLARMLRARGMW